VKLASTAPVKPMLSNAASAPTIKDLRRITPSLPPLQAREA
jgi:hypothetical protein